LFANLFVVFNICSWAWKSSALRSETTSSTCGVAPETATHRLANFGALNLIRPSRAVGNDRQSCIGSLNSPISPLFLSIPLRSAFHLFSLFRPPYSSSSKQSASTITLRLHSTLCLRSLTLCLGTLHSMYVHIRLALLYWRHQSSSSLTAAGTLASSCCQKASVGNNDVDAHTFLLSTDSRMGVKRQFGVVAEIRRVGETRLAACRVALVMSAPDYIGKNAYIGVSSYIHRFRCTSPRS